jgi:hypothetical protein
VIAALDPSFWSSLPYLAAPAAAGLLTVACIAAARAEAV